MLSKQFHRTLADPELVSTCKVCFFQIVQREDEVKLLKEKELEHTQICKPE
jgi:hypothetical protein